jgi:site-specific DNA recombinase
MTPNGGDTLFECAAKIREKNRVTHRNCVKRRTHDFILAGVLYCAECGTKLHGAIAKGHQYAYYQHYKKDHSEACPQIRWTSADVEKTVMKRLQVLSRDEVLLQEIINAANDRMLKNRPMIDGELKRARRDQTDATIKSKRLVTLVLGGNMPTFFEEAAKEAQEEIDAANKRVARLEVERAALLADKLHLSAFRDALSDLPTLLKGLTRQEKKVVMGYLIERIDLGEGGEVTMRLRSEDPEPQKVNHPEREFVQGGKWLPLADSNCGPSD